MSKVSRKSWVSLVLLGILVTLGLEMAGAVMHTVISAVFNETVESYLWKRLHGFSLSHVVLRGVATAMVLGMVARIDDHGFQLKYAVVVWIVSSILLEVVDFSAYLVEFFGTALWSGITGGRTVTLKNVIGCDYREALDVVSRLCQGGLIVFSWWIRTKKIEEDFCWKRQEAIVASNDKLKAANKKLKTSRARLLAWVNHRKNASSYENLSEAVKGLLGEIEVLEIKNSELVSKLKEKEAGEPIMLPMPRE